MDARTKKISAGFTFMEVLIAVALMAAASSLIIGLQSSSVARTLRDRNGQQAALAARRILALVEAKEDTVLDTPSFDGSAYDVLTQLGLTGQEIGPTQDLLSKYQVQLRIDPWEALGPDTMKKLSLTITWGPGDDDHIDYLYFVAL